MIYKNLRLSFILGTSTLLFGACSPTANTPDISAKTAPTTNHADNSQSVTPSAMDAKMKAVLIYADWCGSCKVLDPKVKAAQAATHIPGVEFVTLDYTDKDPINFYAQAKVAGVEEAVKTFFEGTVKTGQLLFVDMDDKLVIGKVTKEKTGSEIMSAVKDAFAAS